MIIIAGNELVDASERNRRVAAHRDLVSRARQFDGCIHVAITADSVDPERINSVEVWRDAAVMDQWRKQADAPDTGKAKHMEVKRYDATDGGPAF
jgi:quinol monooxygenase YgiN